MSGGGGAAGPRLYGYGSALPPAAFLRRGLAAAASGLGSAAVGTTVAGAAPLPSLPSFSPRGGLRVGASPAPGVPPSQSAAAARTADRATREGRFGAATCRPPVLIYFIFYFCDRYCPPLFLSLLRSVVFAGAKDSSAPRGSRSPADAPPWDWGS